MKLTYSLFRLFSLILCTTVLSAGAFDLAAPAYHNDLPPSYEDSVAHSTYTIQLKPGDNRFISFVELFGRGYYNLRVNVASDLKQPHCRLFKQSNGYYRVQLDNMIYDSNLHYDDAVLEIGKLVSVNACRF
ncbi:MULTISPECIES: hypothetical protein [Gammaproteobacteria]|uniref:hypothetical protein n=1 Tax=Gammaproteobacteria TaxID=1236 RepID=UPI001ADA1FC6|nr:MULTISPECIES: hypothetical protein [Gammaproteobacteria]MBO9483177.1 hypothetical protein [Salinisphaera sp. G21_0]MBO9495317.1 hypothetical protein [Thalassotalea sp. G20_0]